MSGIWLPGSALTINLFLTIIFFIKKNTNNDEVKVYKKLLITGLLFCINALAVYIVAKTIDDNYIVGIMQKIHLSLLDVFVYYFLDYNITISSFKTSSKKIINICSLIFILITIILIFISPIEVINYDDILDLDGMSYYVAITNVVVYFLILIIINIKYFLHNQKNIKKNIPFVILIIMFVIGLLLRIHYPEIITETYCVAFALLVMYFTIENPDVKMLEEVSMAKDHAEKANAAKTDFLSSMSHEIRTPLNAIVGFSEAIQDETDLDAAKQDAKDIITASQTLLELVNGILDISKIEANKMEIINGEYNLKEECENLAKLIKTRIGEKDLVLNFQMAKDVPEVLYGDKSKIKEIIMNLLTNAVKYTDKGYINFDVNCINKNGYCSLIISVEDTGRGIKPEKIDKLFNKFERLEEDKNTTIEGVGLGLAITKKLIDMMDGKIVVQSVYGSGSKFTIYLRQKICQKHLEKTLINVMDNLNFPEKKVLVVDDNELNLKVAERLLKKYNLIIETCHSGHECLEKINNGSEYDLILMDIMMPQMSGTDTLHKLQENSSFKTKVVALTADAIEGMQEKYLEEGFNYYLAKPIEKNALERILNRSLSNLSTNNNFEPIPDSFYEIADSIVERINENK